MKNPERDLGFITMFTAIAFLLAGVTVFAVIVLVMAYCGVMYVKRVKR